MFRPTESELDFNQEINFVDAGQINYIQCIAFTWTNTNKHQSSVEAQLINKVRTFLLD